MVLLNLNKDMIIVPFSSQITDANMCMNCVVQNSQRSVPTHPTFNPISAFLPTVCCHLPHILPHGKLKSQDQTRWRLNKTDEENHMPSSCAFLLSHPLIPSSDLSFQICAATVEGVSRRWAMGEAEFLFFSAF